MRQLKRTCGPRSSLAAHESVVISQLHYNQRNAVVIFFGNYLEKCLQEVLPLPDMAVSLLRLSGNAKFYFDIPDQLKQGKLSLRGKHRV